jgi:hypothetical protein
LMSGLSICRPSRIVSSVMVTRLGNMVAIWFSP